MLEVVLAMSLLAMVTAMIYAAFHLGIRSVEKGQNAVVSAQRARAANDVIRRQLKSMFPYPCVAGGDDDTPMPFFNLRENPPMMEFVTAAGMHGGGGLEFVRYEVRGNPPQLVLTALPMLGFDEGKCGSIDTRGAPEAVLLDGFRSLEFEPRAYEEGDSWKSGGSDEFGLPRSVRVKIDGLAGSRTTAESAEWTIPIVANLESEDGFRIFSQMFEEGEGITIAGSAAAEDGDESGKKGATPNTGGDDEPIEGEDD